MGVYRGCGGPYTVYMGLCRERQPGWLGRHVRVAIQALLQFW